MLTSVFSVNNLTKEDLTNEADFDPPLDDTGLVVLQGVNMDLGTKGWIVSPAVEIQTTGIFVLKMTASPCGSLEPKDIEISGVSHDTSEGIILLGSRLLMTFEESLTSECKVEGDPRIFYGGIEIIDDCNLIHLCDQLFGVLSEF